MTFLEIEILVCEEDYKYDVSDFDKFTAEKKLEILRDVNSSDESFVWRELWLGTDEPQCQYMSWEIHELLGRTFYIVSTKERK